MGATPPVLYDLIRLQGGLDLVTPTLSLPPGTVRDSVNFECSITGGYSRIVGYERFDGQPNPSDATYTVLNVTFSAAVVAGNSIYGASSTATGVVIAVTDSTIVITKASGVFTPGENIQVLGLTKAVFGSYAGAPSNAQNAQYLALAANVYRADIDPVPGTGPIRGVCFFNGHVYAWRDDVGGLTKNIYKSSASGWQFVSLGYEMEFNLGTAEPEEGITITGRTSGATATFKRAAIESGTFLAGDAAGRLIIAALTGSFSPGEIVEDNAAVALATVVSAQTAIELVSGGRVETAIGNFGGVGNATRVYGADGVSQGFEFDGEVYVPIRTGMTDDTPDHVAVHKSHLFFSFGSSIQHSALGNPYAYSPLLGAGELAMPDTLTAFLVQPGNQGTGAMAVYTTSDTYVLYGNDSSSWSLQPFNVGTGAKAYTGQNLTQGYVFNERGIQNLATTLNYGNFATASLTLNLRPFIQQRRNLATASVINREKAQYRVFFSDGYGLYMTVFNGKILGTMPVLFPNPVSCIHEGETPDGTETAFFGSSNGYVYRLDAGTSFDGAEIPANMVLVFNAIKSPRMLKRYRKGSLEVTGEGYAEFTFSYDLGYQSTDIPQDTGATYTSNLVASYWDSAAWDSFIWDGRTLAPSEVEVRGTAENIAVRIASISAIYPSFTINSVILHYSMRRGLR